MGITVVSITHYMEEAAQADRVLVMSKGHVVMEGTCLLYTSSTARSQRFRRAGATKKGLLAPFNPKEVGYTGKN